jgi:hypothetical protein
MSTTKEKEYSTTTTTTTKGSELAISSEWVAKLAHDPIYSGIDVQREFGMMCHKMGEQKKTITRLRFLNWLSLARKSKSNGSSNGEREEEVEEPPDNGWTPRRLGIRLTLFPEVTEWPERFDSLPAEMRLRFIQDNL